MKIVITGGNGTMAKAIASILTKEWHLVLLPNKKELDVVNRFSVINYMEINKPEVLINCAGYINPSKLAVGDDYDFIKHFQINLFGIYFCSKYAFLNGCKTIINIGSTSAFEGREEWGAYCSSKSALLGLSETLAKEGMFSFTINPARTDTKMRERLFPEENKLTLMKPERIGEFVLKCLNNDFSNGSHIIVKKDYYYVLSPREVMK